MKTVSERGPRARPRIALVLGGGALKGFAHIGALRALREARIRPRVYSGSSIGAMIAAAAASGMPIDVMAERALSLKRKDLFRINHMGMLLERMQSRSIYLEEPLRALCDEVVAEGTFDDLSARLLVTAVDIERGTPVVFGTAGLTGVRVRDAVYASCALPGFFPPGDVGGRMCFDGGTTDNLPVSIAATGVDAVIAVDVGIADVPVEAGLASQGFASVFMRAVTMMMHAQEQHTLERWKAPPMLLVRPDVSHVGWFSFAHTEQLLSCGYDAMRSALTHLDAVLQSGGGVFPRREVQVTVDRATCTGCELCVARAPHEMRLDTQGKAVPLARSFNWSPADGDFVRQCPVNAIRVTNVGAGQDNVPDQPSKSA
jgi:NTE family protein